LSGIKVPEDGHVGIAVERLVLERTEPEVGVIVVKVNAFKVLASLLLKLFFFVNDSNAK
jgi:hypothetical protein